MTSTPARLTEALAADERRRLLEEQAPAQVPT